MPYHCKIELPVALPCPWDTNPFWAICDHPMTVSFDRLNLIRLKKDQYGKRKYYQKKLDQEDLNNIRTGLLLALGLEKP